MILSSLLPITGSSAAAAASVAECESVDAILANTSEKLLYLKQIRQQFRGHLADTDSETRLDAEKMLQELAQPGERAMTRSQLRKRVQDMVDQVNALKQDLDKMRFTIAVLV